MFEPSSKTHRNNQEKTRDRIFRGKLYIERDEDIKLFHASEEAQAVRKPGK